MGRHPEYAPLNENQKKFIREKHRDKTVSEMAATLHAPVKKIYEYMKENDLQTLDKSKKPKLVEDGYFNVRERDWFIG